MIRVDKSSSLQGGKDSPNRWQWCLRVTNNVQLACREAFLSANILVVNPFEGRMIYGPNTENL